MNKVFRIVWNDVRKSYVVASEHAATRGKPASTVKRAASALAGALIAQAAYAAPAPNALPTGGQVVAGLAAIAQSGNAMTINQASQQTILNWNTFNIGANASVNFQQPSANAVALNRVVGSDPSAIYGSLTANGQVFLVNPNGVLFGQGARVNVGGLVATTLSIRNEDFLAGSNRFTRDGAMGGVVNQGTIDAKYVAMLAPEVRNEGVIAAQMGTVALAAGEAVTLNLTGNQLIGVQVDKASINTLVENKRLVQAEGGTVILSAQSANQLLGQVVNSGAVEAQGLINDGGTVRLLASGNIDHSGSINADAGTNGKGGQVTLIADLSNTNSRTTVSGSISARGGSASGDGGFVETSASHLTITDTASINTRASHGQSGNWLLDPNDFKIAASGGDITGAALATALGLGGVTIQTTATTANCTGATCGTGTAGNGDIFVNDAVSWTAANTLTLNAWRNIVINSAISAPAGGGLALQYAQSNTLFNVPVGAYTVNAPVNLTATSSFSTKYASDGIPVSYTVLTNQAGLTGMTLNNANVNYVLGNSVTASGAWTPIGTSVSPFSGIFDGLGHVVDGITISTAADNAGMFGNLAGAALVQNIGVTNVNITGTRFVGALAGQNQGVIYHAYSTGSVTGATANATPITAIGGLVGTSTGIITQSRSSATVTGSNDAAGNTYSGIGVDGGIGGLVGILTTANITDSYATGTVKGIRDVGGLVGYANAFSVINTSYASGGVTLQAYANGGGNQGGLVGNGAVGLSGLGNFWDTTATGQATSYGGIATGMNTANMQTAANFTSATAANGNVNPNWAPATWTLTNGNYPTIVFSNATAPLIDSIIIELPSLSQTYGTPTQPKFGAYILTSGGSLLTGDTLSFSWGTAWSGTLNVSGGPYAFSTANLVTPVITSTSGHTLSNYNISWVAPSTSYNSLTVKPLDLGFILLNGGSSTYGAALAVPSLTTAYIGPTNSAYSQSYATNALSADPITSSAVGITTTAANYSTSNNLKAGTYPEHLTSITFADPNNYTYSSSNFFGSYTVIKKPLTVTGQTASDKTYDQTTAATLTGGTLSGLITGDNVTLSQSGNFALFTAGTNKQVTASDGISGADAGNYTVTQPANMTATIKPASLTIIANDLQWNYQDPWPPSYTYSYQGLVGNDTEAILTTRPSSTTTATLLSPAGTTYPITPGGAAATNYAITYKNGHLTITTPVNAEAIVFALMNEGAASTDQNTGLHNLFNELFQNRMNDINKALSSSDAPSNIIQDSEFSADMSTSVSVALGSQMLRKSGRLSYNHDFVAANITPQKALDTVNGSIRALCPSCAPLTFMDYVTDVSKYDTKYGK